MKTGKRHKLIERQIEKHNITSSCADNFENFVKAVDESYQSADNDVAHLEKMLQLSKEELYAANQKLEKENIEKSQEAIYMKNQLDNVMANVNDIMIEMDKDGNFTYLNPAWIQYGEESREESIGKNFMEFSKGIEYFDKEDFRRIMERDFESDTFETVFSKYSKAKELKWWKFTAKLLTDDSEKLTGAVVALRDITAIKKVEQDLIKANEAKDRFLSTMSHEIRTPLNAVIAISNILAIQDPKPSQRENLEVLKYSSNNLLNLINDILDFNKLSTGNLTFENAPFNLGQNFNNIIKSYSYLLIDKPVSLNLEIDEKVHLGACGDSIRLTQIIGNLVNNAIKFTPEGTVTLKVDQLETNDEFQTLRIKVIDTGIGIPADKLDYIFERFTQAEDHTTKNFGGTGLGLAICKKLLQLQGSDIFVESTLGEGTTFWFDIKYGIENCCKLLGKEKVEISEYNLQGMKLLIVDDNPINIIVATQFFDEWNIEYKVANGYSEAMALYNKEEYDLILMDLQMPDKDGYETSREIRASNQKNSNLPIIALSASTSNDVKEKVLAAGMDDFLSKPFDPADLFVKLRKYKKHSLVEVGA